MDEDFNRLVMECNNCHLQFYANELSIEPISNLLVCKNCLAFPNGKVKIIKDRPLKKEEKNNKPLFRVQPRPMPVQPKPVVKEDKEVIKNAPLPKMDSLMASNSYKNYKCDNCRYSFSRKPGNFNGFCPYCGKKIGATY